MTVTHTLEAELRTVHNSYGITPVTVVALPGSDADPAVGKLRVYVDGSLVVRDYDETMEQP